MMGPRQEEFLNEISPKCRMLQSVPMPAFGSNSPTEVPAKVVRRWIAKNFPMACSTACAACVHIVIVFVGKFASVRPRARP